MNILQQTSIGIEQACDTLRTGKLVDLSRSSLVRHLSQCTRPHSSEPSLSGQGAILFTEGERFPNECPQGTNGRPQGATLLYTTCVACNKGYSRGAPCGRPLVSCQEMALL